MRLMFKFLEHLPYVATVLKLRTLISLCSQIKCWLSRLKKMLVRKANWDDADQSDLGLPCLSLIWVSPVCLGFLQASTVPNFRTCTVYELNTEMLVIFLVL